MTADVSELLEKALALPGRGSRRLAALLSDAS
jgi:hypothetical protein